MQVLEQFAQRWEAIAFTVLWQAVLLAIVAWLACAMLQRASATIRFWIWQLVAIKLLLIPFWTIVVPYPTWLVAEGGDATVESLPVDPNAANQTEPKQAKEGHAKTQRSKGPALKVEVQPQLPPPTNEEISGTDRTKIPRDDLAASNLIVAPGREVATAPAATVPSHDPSQSANMQSRAWPIGSALVALWLVAVFWQLARLWGIRRRLKTLLTQSTTASQELHELVGVLAAKLRVKAPDVLLTDQVNSPFVCGLLRPTIVMPKALAMQLSEEQIQQVVAHELAHLRRGDLWWNWIHELMRIIYFFHPAIYWIRSRLHLERELACDQWAMRSCNSSAQQYALTLVDVLSHMWKPGGLPDGQGDSTSHQAECSSP